ncbi:bifunctional D-glycero-beta-D-manno-heptose-7-phosphate kinase/D-glycero-beta-D-manno-heptose 1-phosphate adenylyltransferase HldE [Suttonella indologenes]|uniref:Bifunctional protein HldE n=1 Tax=Suttonella indologenes TaxID=13276 RepID=A0A380MNI6_9GAMM|nr:bifunctional D-glycero-beta-D-manno-heptose-7-phosphate kinase/D-glycero-beta-D-manno-heptose 1-phosphate adenylyltransferase HldE [Suttonella indologenes]SUO92741.1 Bifunctional protein hldE [Suttonella indologenes]
MSEQRNTPDFSAASVLVIGDVMLDRNWQGDTQRISPEAPVPVVNISRQEARAGGAANVAMNLAALGAKVALCGLVGDDEAGGQLRAIIRQQGITDLMKNCPADTITKLRVLSRHQQLMRLDFEAKDYARYAELLAAPFEKAVDEADVVVFSDYGKGALADVSRLIAKAKQAGKLVLLDPKGSDYARYRGADIITPNRSELALATGNADEAHLLANTRRLLDDCGIQAVLLTLSEKGMRYVAAQTEHYLAAQAREVYDVTGAGDTVIATLAAALAIKTPLPQALEYANAAAGVVVGKLGTSTLSPEELRAALEPPRARSHGVVDKESLKRLIARARTRGQKIVMTNGCFDILHAGHVTYLAEAKALGDRLIVAVNTDESVRRLKGESRPANNLHSRAAVLAALQSVDWVVVFEEDTPAQLIEELMPDILVKGGDNRVEDIPGAQAVLAKGGEVKIMSYVDGFSTTKTLSKYQKEQ